MLLSSGFHMQHLGGCLLVCSKFNNISMGTSEMAELACKLSWKLQKKINLFLNFPVKSYSTQTVDL